MKVRCVGLALVSSLLSAEAFAENGKLNFSIEPAVPVDISSDQGASTGSGIGFHIDWTFSKRIALQARYQGSLFTFPDPVTQENINKISGILTGGFRLYPAILNDQKGYKVHVGNKRGHEGNLWGNLWLDLGVGVGYDGVGLADKDVAPKLDAGIGYNLSLFDGVLLGPYFRAQAALPPAAYGVSIGIAA
jgi:hypothetical protein